MNKLALITGASGGIGLELARLMATDSYDLALVARNKQRLNEIALELEDKHSVKVKVIASDLAIPDAARGVYDELKAHNMDVNVLVNNAGVGDLGLFVERPLEKQMQMIHLNIGALTQLSHLFGKEMVETGNGKILNVASTAAFQPGPLMAVYFASKAYVLSLSEALANEFHGKGVTVTCLCPGPTSTSFMNNANIRDTSAKQKSFFATAEEVARFGYNAMKRGQPVAIEGFGNKLMAASAKFSPRPLVLKVVRNMYEKLKKE